MFFISCPADGQVSKQVSSLPAECGVNVLSLIHMAGSERRITQYFNLYWRTAKTSGVILADTNC